jgi:hypothetical protein
MDGFITSVGSLILLFQARGETPAPERRDAVQVLTDRELNGVVGRVGRVRFRVKFR